MTIRTKAELLELFADNFTGDISAADLRDFVIANLSFEPVQIDTTPYTVTVEVDVANIVAGASFIQLPPAADYGFRTLRLQNRRGQSVIVAPSPGELISAKTSVELPDGVDLMLAGNRQTWSGEVVPSIASMQGRAGEIWTVAPGEDAARWRNIWLVFNEAGPVPPP